MIPTSPIKATWKGKAPARDPQPISEFIDLDPVITYRHLLSNSLGVRDPFRVIALCDSDAFYAACEMVRLNVDPDTPLVVLQWDSLIAVNYPARKYGISRMDKKQDAIKRCPHLRVVHVATYKEGEAEPGYWDDIDTNTHKVSLDLYRRESSKIAAMFIEGLPNCEVEKASIDEAFIDFTQAAKVTILERYPYLATFPVNSPLGIDTPLPDPPELIWNEEFGSLIPINPARPVTPQEIETEPTDKDGEPATSGSLTLPSVGTHQAEDFLSIDEAKTSWHDMALSIAAEMMQKMRDEVRTKLGYTMSAGLARNKFLAKLTASYRKPNGQSILRNAAIPNYLRPMPFQKIRFLGGKLGNAIAKEFDVSTVGDLLRIPLDELQSKFGEESVWVYELLRGVDRNEVKSKGSATNKSMLASKNLPRPIVKPAEGHHWIRVLAAELALRLNESRKLNSNLWPKTIVLHARRGYETGRSKQAPFPFTKDLTVEFIAAAGDKLWKELIGTRDTINVSSVQLAFTGIEESEAGQQSIDAFLKPRGSAKRTWDEEVGGGEIVQHGDNQPDDKERRLSFTCSRCTKTFYLPRATTTNAIMESVADDDQVIAALAKLRAEHDDFHFAQDLSKEFSLNTVIKPSKPGESTTGKGSSSSAPKATKKQKKGVEPKGIEQFFRKSKS